MNYRGVADLNGQLVRSLSTLPRDLDLIVGVPRSGLLVANLLSLHLNLPMTDVDGLIQGRVLRTGSRYLGGSTDELLRKKRNVLVVDDSVCSGSQMAKVRQQIRQAHLPHRICYGAVYVLPETYAAGDVDWFVESLPTPRVFEWNLMHNKPVLSQACVAIDGVLFQHGAVARGGDGGHGDSPQSASPVYLPTHPVGWLVTSRHKRYRAQTEALLARCGVQYNHLIMAEDREVLESAEAEAAFKADAYLRTGAQLFIEASPEVAAGVAETSRKPVFSMGTGEMMYPGGMTHRMQLSAGASALRFGPGNEILRLSRTYIYRLLLRARAMVGANAATEPTK